jgi:hypothetical protein
MSSEKSRQHHDGSSGRAYTPDQKAAVVRVRKCNPTAFYDILGLEATKKTATESDIKKAYRKLSLLTHPDKNGYEGADEAFKIVARAFAVLSDADKKAKYDRFGGDPDSRFGGATSSSASPFSGAGGGAARRGGGGGGMFDDEISPEDLFRQFFGGGMGGGGPFGGMGGGPFGKFGPLFLHLSSSNSLLQAADSSTALPSPSTWVAAPASVSTNSAAAHPDDDRVNPPTPTPLPHPSCSPSNRFSHYYSSSSCPSSLVSSPAIPLPVLPSASTPSHRIHIITSLPNCKYRIMSTRARYLTLRPKNGGSLTKEPSKALSTNCRTSVMLSINGRGRCMSRHRASSSPIRSNCSRLGAWNCLLVGS